MTTEELIKLEWESKGFKVSKVTLVGDTYVVTGTPPKFWKDLTFYPNTTVEIENVTRLKVEEK